MNFIAYRLPGSKKKNIFSTGKALRDYNPETTEAPGFLVAPFNFKEPPYLFPLKGRLGMDDIVTARIQIGNYAFKEVERDEYTRYIEEIKKAINGSTDRKVVASRRLILPFSENLSSVFENLCEEFPEAFVFLVNTEETGCWIGASPELLLEKNGNEFKSMALAGTRICVPGSRDWDRKNIEEQDIVARHIGEVFRKNGIECSQSDKRNLRYGKIEHICTNIIGRVLAQDFPTEKLISDLYPTPALCGNPKEFAFDIINSNEGDRGLYGGFLGPLDEKCDFKLYVTIRCAYISKDITLFGGGGITHLSNPEEEWEETVHKMASMKKLLNL